MAAVFGALGSLLTPGKEPESKPPVATDAIDNGAEAERTNEPQTNSISSAEDNSAHDSERNSLPTEKLADEAKKTKNTKSQSKGGISDPVSAIAAIGGDCGMCKKSITNKQAVGCAKCGFCDDIFCKDCSQFTSHMCQTVLERADVLWACYSCLPRLENAKLATPLTGTPENVADIIADGGSVLRKFDELKGEINSMINDKVVPQLITKIEQSISTLNANITNQWCTMPGANAFAEGCHSSNESDDSGDEEFPEDGMTRVMTKKQRKAAVRQSREYTASLKIAQAALASQKEDEDRQKNILVYRLPETLTSASDARKNEKETIAELLNVLDVNSAPVEIKRLGKFDSDKVNDKPRPIKVVFNNKISRDEAINNARNLGKATDAKIKNLQICYDLSREQREQQKVKLDEAKELSKNSETHVWRVRGTPGNMFVKKFEKRAK